MSRRISIFRRLRGVLSLILLCSLAAVAGAQIDQGSVTGIVRDAQERVIAGATVTLVNTDTNLTLTRVTGDSGVYTFTPIKIGNYTVSVSAPGFVTQVSKQLRVDVSQTASVNFKLQAGGSSETVTVTADTQLQTEQASTGQVFSAEVINDLPLDGRNYVFAAQLTTGVAAPNQGFRQVAGAGDFTSNGNRVSQNNFVLDGVDNNSNMQDFLNGATYAVRPPPDALAEFKVESSDYSAELGRSTGAAINASIKSGSNQLHGSLWEYLRNDRMDALDYFATSRTAYHENLFGATLGGPFWKDKAFFFADAQGTRISSYVPPNPNQTVPTALERQGDFSELLDPTKTTLNAPINLYQVGGNVTTTVGGTDAPGYAPRYLNCNGQQNVICPGNVNQIAKNILNLFPLPNQGVPGQVLKNYTVPATSTTNNTTQYDVRVDYNFSPKDQMFGRYSYSNNPTTFTAPFGVLDGAGYGGDGQNSNYSKSGVFSETHFFSPTLSNEFRLGYNWLHAAYLQTGSATNLAGQLGLGGIPTGANLGGLPSINFSGALNGIGVPAYEPSDELQNVGQIIDNVTKILGPHTLKAGLNFQHVRFHGLQPPNGIGYQNFTGLYTSDPGQPNAQTGSGVADFLLDMMHDSGMNTVTPFTDLRWYYSAFLQDDWKANARLTVNLGLRWEYTQPIRELNNEQANFYGTYAGMNQGSGVYLIPASQQRFPLSSTWVNTLAADHISIQYTSNDYLVNPRKMNFAPRIGVSFMADPKTVFRAGAGIFYGGLENIGLGLNLANNAPFFVGASFVPNPDQCYNVLGTVSCPTNGQTLETGFGAAATSASALADAAGIGTIYAQDQNAKSSYTTSYNLTMQHSITDTLSFSIGYQGNQSKHLRSSYSANTYPGYVPLGQNSQLYQPFHDFSVTNVASAGVGRYDSLQAKIEKKYSNGLYFLGGYTWAHCLDDAFGPIGQSGYGGYRNPNLLGFKYDYGSCTQDVRNRFTVTGQYSLPFGKGRQFLNSNRAVDAVVGQWKASLTFQAQSGDPVFVTSSNQGSSYPFRVSDPMKPGGTAGSNPTQLNFNCASKTRTLTQWFNPCAFENPPQATLGSTDPTQNLINTNQAGLLPSGPRGRQSVYGPGFNRVDMSLFKDFTIPFRETKLQLRADGFNILNHPSFGNPGTGLTGTGSQAITSTRFSSIIPDARVIQVAARLSF